MGRRGDIVGDEIDGMAGLLLLALACLLSLACLLACSPLLICLLFLLLVCSHLLALICLLFLLLAPIQDNYMAILSHQVYRCILSEISTRRVAEMMDVMYNSIDVLQANLDKKKAPSGAGGTYSTMRRAGKKKSAIAELASSSPNIPYARGIVAQLLMTFQCMVPCLSEQNSLSALQLLFWGSISLLRTTDNLFAPLTNEALKLCLQLVNHGFFQRIKSEETAGVEGSSFVEMKAILEKSPEWYFRGVLPLIIQVRELFCAFFPLPFSAPAPSFQFSSVFSSIFQGLYNPQTERVAGELLARISHIEESHDLIYSNRRAVFPVSVVGILPWIQGKLNVIGSIDRVVCLSLARSLSLLVC